MEKLLSQSSEASPCMHWHLTYRADPRAARVADRHYSRQTIGAVQFAPPGRCLVLITENASALWVTSWPYPEYVNRQWKDAWICTLFRNESTYLSSGLILEAVAVTRWRYGSPPLSGMITIVNPSKIQSANPGYCFKRAGFKRAGYTKEDRLPVLQLLPSRMPEPTLPYGATLSFLEGVI